MIEKNGTWDEGLDVRTMSMLEAKASVGYGGVKKGWKSLKGKDNRVV